MELEIGSIADSDKNAITDISIHLSSNGATVTFVSGGTCFFDYMWKWDAQEELENDWNAVKKSDAMFLDPFQ